MEHRMPDPRPPQESQADGAADDAGEPGLDRTLPDEITGRADATDEDLTSLFENDSKRHLSDGFHGASGDDAAGTISSGEVPDDLGNYPELE
jgi:hypothetical protein